MGSRRAIPLAALGVAALLVALLAYGLASTKEDRSLDKAVAGGQREQAKDHRLGCLSGCSGNAALADYRGKVVLLNLWASWCTPCKDEVPILERAWRRYGRDGLVILGVDTLDLSGNAKQFIRTYGVTYPNVSDGEGVFKKDYGTAALPETFVVDREGRIASIRRGQLDAAYIRQAVLPVLREGTSS